MPVEWYEGDMIMLAKQRGIFHVAFTANSTLNGQRLVMGAGAALDVKKQFPKIDLNLGTELVYLREVESIEGDYNVLSVQAVSSGTRGWLGSESIADVVRVTAVQVKRDWRHIADWELTKTSLGLFRDYLRHLLSTGEQGSAVINCPLIGMGGYSAQREQVIAMVEKQLQGADVIVCLK